MEPTQDLVASLNLAPHPEGGWFRRTWTSPAVIETPRGPRRAVSSILYLLDAGDTSAWHRVHGSRELWLWQGGGRLDVVTAGFGDAISDPESHLIGPPGTALSQFFVEPGQWQRTRTIDDGWTLVTCVVSPGFDFADFEMVAAD